MFESMMNFFKRFGKNEKESSKVAAKERLHLVLAQDRANISADFLEMMKQEIIEVIKKYVDIDEGAIDVKMTNKPGEDGTIGAPALYANIPIVTIKNDTRKLEGITQKKEETAESSNIEENNEIEVENDKEENEVPEIKNEIQNEETEKVEDNKGDIEQTENMEQRHKTENFKKDENKGERQAVSEETEKRNNGQQYNRRKTRGKKPNRNWQKGDRKNFSNYNNYKKKK